MGQDVGTHIAEHAGFILINTEEVEIGLCFFLGKLHAIIKTDSNINLKQSYFTLVINSNFVRYDFG